MTLVALHAEADRVRVMTDSIAYTEHGDRAAVSRGGKVAVLPRVGAVVTSSGSAPAGAVWAWVAGRLKVRDFDAFLAALPDTVAWVDSKVREIGETLVGADRLQVYAAGWSPARSRYVAAAAHPEDGHEPRDVSDRLHVSLTPPGFEPTEIERARGVPLPASDRVLEPPAVVEGWAALARLIHETRACAPVGSGLKTWIGGDVTLTTLTADGARQRVIHTFGTDDFRRAAAGTFHPFGQVQACTCGSGRRFVDCHIPQWRHLPCHCGSGSTLGECCALDRADADRLLDEHPELRDLAGVRS